MLSRATTSEGRRKFPGICQATLRDLYVFPQVREFNVPLGRSDHAGELVWLPVL